MAKGKILVTGASGQQGGATARALLQAGQKIRVMGRSAERLQPLKDLGAEVFIGDLNDKKTATKALDGCNRAFLVTTFAESGTEMETLQGMHFIDAARKRDLQHLVFTSVAGSDQNTHVSMIESKWRVEQYLHAYRVPYTVLRPAWFMENLEAPAFQGFFQDEMVMMPLSPKVKVDMVAVQDIGAFAAAALTRPSEFIGQTIGLAGDSLTMPEALAKYSKATGKSYRYQEMPKEVAEQNVPADYQALFHFLSVQGFGVNLAETAEWGVPLTTYDQYLAKAKRVKV